MPRLWELLSAALPISGAAQLNEPLKTLIWTFLRQRPSDVRFVLAKELPAAPATQTWVSPPGCISPSALHVSLSTLRCSMVQVIGYKAEEVRARLSSTRGPSGVTSSAVAVDHVLADSLSMQFAAILRHR